MAQQPPPTGSAAARSALAQKLSGVPPDYFVIKLYQMHDLGVPLCCGAFTPSTRVVSRR